MKQLLPLLRKILKYKRSLATSIFCSVIVGVLWGANVGALYPILIVIFNGDSLQEVVAKRAEQSKASCAELETAISLANSEIREAVDSDKEVVRQELLQNHARLEQEQWVLAGWQRLEVFVDKYVPSGVLATMALILGVVMFATVVRGIFQALNDIIVARLSHKIVFDLRVRFYRQTLNLDLARLTEDRTARLMSRFTHDVSRINEGLGAILGQSVQDPIKILVCLGGAALISWQLLLFTLIIVPPAIFLLRCLAHLAKKTDHESMDAIAAIYSQLEQSLNAAKLVKAFGMERFERKRFYQICKGILFRRQRGQAVRAFIRPSLEVLSLAAISLGILAGTYFVAGGHTQLFGMQMFAQPLQGPSLLLFVSFLISAGEPVKRLSMLTLRIHRTVAALERIDKAMRRKPRVCNPKNPVAVPDRWDTVEFKEVRYRYPGGERVLRNIDLSISAGQMIAIVGPNGCGKTTLVNLIPRFYDPKHGEVRINGIDIRTVSMQSLRRKIALVPQETLLFDDTVVNNIRYGHPHASEEEIVESAKKADAHAFITSKLQDGYDTIIGERGGFLSGGQRQRIALARALLRNPEILILDEALGEVDSSGKGIVYESLRSIMRDKITIIIAHHNCALEAADRVIMMGNRRVLEDASHAELLKSSPKYQKMFLERKRIAA